MSGYSTNQAANKLGLSVMTMHRYMKAKKIPVFRMRELGGVRVRIWTDEQIEAVRKLLPKIANGRKSRWQKKQSAISSRQSGKTKAQPRAAVPHKSRKPKKK